jgi:hypothetical protein
LGWPSLCSGIKKILLQYFWDGRLHFVRRHQENPFLIINDGRLHFVRRHQENPFLIINDG